MFNCHTHIFHDEHVPEHFLPGIAKPLVNLLENGKITSALEKACRNVNLDGLASQIAKFHSFTVNSASKPEQNTLDKTLIPAYPPGTRFIVLTMDMEYMEAGKPRRSFINQLDTLAQLTRFQKYKNIIHPFVAVDPRRPDVFKEMRRRIEKDNYWGIKMYPPLGFFPFDERLNEVYAYAQDNQIPIMTHCTRGGVFYRGHIHNVHPISGKTIPGRNNNHLSEGFTDPNNYVFLLEKYPNLKICFAHYGGQGEWVYKKSYNPNDPAAHKPWPDVINELLLNPKYPELYTDISYTLYDTATCLEPLQTYMQDPVLRTKIMYGSDFYMQTQEMNEELFLSGVQKGLSQEDFERLSHSNVLNYLNSKIRKIEGEPSLATEVKPLA